MHEASLINDFMRRLGEVAANNQSDRISSISVRLGALCHISKAHFVEHFNHAAKGSAAEHAFLHITVSDDPHHPDAQHVILESIELESIQT